MMISYFVILMMALITLTLVCVFDTLKGIIPNTLSLLLFTLGLASLFLDKTMTNPFVPTSFAVGVFCFQFILFATNENSIGGGDIKILTSCTLFMHNLQMMIVFFIAYTVMTIILTLVYKFDGKSDIRIGASFGIAFAVSMVLHYESLTVFGINTSNFPFSLALIISTISFMITYTIYNSKTLKGVLNEYSTYKKEYSI